ncbi:MAG: DUF58 domain-containing protein [Lachnospiraceae bacterium]|nr:DUF58 domain-containing protein [Lachnospiraceae bacterium]
MITLFIIPGLILLFLWIKLYGKICAHKLSIRILFSDGHIYAGEETLLSETVENRKSFPIPAVAIRFLIPRGIDFIDAENTSFSDHTYKKDVFSLAGMESVQRNYRVLGVKRGYYKVTEPEARFRSLLNFRVYGKDFVESEDATLGSIYVYAANRDVSDIMKPVDAILGSLETIRGIYEDPFAFASIREYTPTDPQRSINWKASAKTGDLMVNTFFSTASPEARVCLDVSENDRDSETDLTEESIALAASVARVLVKHGLRVVFAVNASVDDKGYTLFSGDPGKTLLRNLEEFLASDLSSMKKCNFGDMPETTADEKENAGLTLYISKNIKDIDEFTYPKGDRDGGKICVVPCKQGSGISRKIHLLT